ncbi:REST corepressor isoform X2 [Dendroctonus ponderosae]|uniref:REST corepressor isoform X2 n=1 Tax=Dendroctonus ponderosae TaxID=77166 RepID=UPI002035A005|nr:REST corepressor isoform X2 [Dendroctonus ponderosae]
MVLADKNETVRNGRRSRGPSPQNGNVQLESTSEEESPVPVDKIRVGRDFQATCPELQPEAQRRPEQLADRALLVWSPTEAIPDIKLENYIVLAKDKYGYNGEQALGMLFWHKHDLDRAMLDLANFTPFPDEWSVEDKVLFEQAFQFHGKSFYRIRQMLPDKSIASLVKYYYSWKKTRSKTSLMDKQARKLNNSKGEGGAAEEGEEHGSNEDSDHDEKRWTFHRGINRKSGTSSRTGQSSRDSATQIQQNKQTVSSLKRKHADTVDELRPSDEKQRNNPRWSNEELMLAVQGFRKYGKDYKAIAEMMGNKTEQYVRTFFANYRKKYNLDQLIKDWERSNGHSPEDAAEDNDDVICLSPSPSKKECLKNGGKVVAGHATK